MSLTTVKNEVDQLVAFSLGDEELAFPIGLVQEIVRPPDITKVPNAPGYIEGIANLRGAILPVVNLRSRIGLPLKEMDEATRVVVINIGGVATGTIVDSVSEVLHIDESVIEAPPEVVSGIDGQYLRGIAKINQGKRLVMILSEENIVPVLRRDRPSATSTLSGISSESGPDHLRRAEEEELLVTFNLADEEFAVDIMKVQEIIRVTEITKVPRAPEFVRGVMSLRNRLLPIIDLRKRFGMAEQGDAAQAHPGQPDSENSEETDSRRIVVVDLGGVLTGLQVDSVSEVLRLTRSDIEAPPAMLSDENAARLKGIGKLQGGERLLMLLDIERLVSTEERQALERAAGDQSQGALSVNHEKEIDNETQLVCFKIDNEEYGLDIMRVQEIIRVEEITAVPRAPEFVEGMVNLRGNVLPVIDMRTRFELERAERSGQNRIMVVDIAGKTTGIIVDSVTEVLRIPNKQIEPPPAVVADGVRGRYIQGIGKLSGGKRLIILVNVDSILSDGEAASYANMSESKPGHGETQSTGNGKSAADNLAPGRKRSSRPQGKE